MMESFFPFSFFYFFFFFPAIACRDNNNGTSPNHNNSNNKNKNVLYHVKLIFYFDKNADIMSICKRRFMVSSLLSPQRVRKWFTLNDDADGKHLLSVSYRNSIHYRQLLRYYLSYWMSSFAQTDRHPNQMSRWCVFCFYSLSANACCLLGHIFANKTIK